MIGFTVDGTSWPYFCQVKRKAEMRSTEISGMLITGAYFNDVLGTYFSYDVTIAVPMADRDRYAQLYEILTDPVDGHTFVLPYNNTQLSLTARVSQVSDEFYPVDTNGAYWLAQTFTLISNYPTKQLSLGEVIRRGTAPGPDLSNPEIGEARMWNGTSWALIPDADDTSF